MRNQVVKKWTVILLLSIGFWAKLYSEKIGPWELDSLYKVPEWEISNLAPVNGMKSILYHSLEYLGNPVQVFAYYNAPAGVPPEGGWPAVVYAHGGGGTAISSWVTYWNNHGYACITMDLEGHYPETDEDGNRYSTPNPGPARSGVFNDYEKTIEEQWYYHAIAQVIIAHTLIASFPEVNATKIGVTGTSWGGTITSTVMGVDSRWAWATPVYGTGYLSGSDGNQGRQLAKDDDKIAFVDTYYDGSVYFENVTFPTMWVTGTNDYHFPLTISQKSSQSVNGPATLLWALRFGHGNTTAQNLDQMYLFADQVVKDGPSLIKFEKPVLEGNRLYARYATDLSVNSAQILYTYDRSAIWPDKYWYSKDATVIGDSIIAIVPAGACVAFLNATDSRGATVNTEYIEIEVKTENWTGDTIQIAPRTKDVFCIGIDKNESVSLTERMFSDDLTWEEIDRGNGYYSYQHIKTGFCMHGGNPDQEGEDVYLWNCDSEDDDQLWLKAEADSGYYRLLKANMPELALTFENNNVLLKAADENNQLQHWKNISYSQLAFKITDGSNFKNLEGVSILVDGQTLESDNSGEAMVNLSNKQYSIALFKKGYLPVSLNLDLVEDTLLQLKFEKERYACTLQVSNVESNQALSDVLMELNDSVYKSDEEGRIYLMLEFGTHAYVLGLEAYNNINETITIESDTTIYVQMELFKYRLAFRVKDATTNALIPYTTIVLNNMVYETNPYGSLSFELPPESLSYVISKDGYEKISGMFTLEKDTTITHFLNESALALGLKKNEINIYPNPCLDIINITGFDNEYELNYKIINGMGAVVQEGVLGEKLDVSELYSGVYFLFLKDNKGELFNHILIKQ